VKGKKREKGKGKGEKGGKAEKGKGSRENLKLERWEKGIGDQGKAEKGKGNKL
jgi:hypothetical protein